MALSRIRVLATDYQQGKGVPCEPIVFECMKEG